MDKILRIYDYRIGWFLILLIPKSYNRVQTIKFTEEKLEKNESYG